MKKTGLLLLLTFLILAVNGFSAAKSGKCSEKISSQATLVLFADDPDEPEGDNNNVDDGAIDDGAIDNIDNGAVDNVDNGDVDNTDDGAK